MANIGPMTKDDLALAGFLKMVAEGADRWADRIDPERSFANWQSSQLDAIASKAAYTFGLLVGLGRRPRDVSSADLNTESPAAWTQLPYDKRSR